MQRHWAICLRARTDERPDFLKRWPLFEEEGPFFSRRVLLEAFIPGHVGPYSRGHPVDRGESTTRKLSTNAEGVRTRKSVEE